LALQADSVLGDRVPEIEDFARLPFAHQVMFEALRLYPQPPVLIRRNMEDDVYQGYHVPKGSDVFISSYSIHRWASVQPGLPM
jgi:beta-ring hydroxylase